MYTTGNSSMHKSSNDLEFLDLYHKKEKVVLINIYLSGLIERQIAGVQIQMERVVLDVGLRSILGRVQI